MIIYLICYVFTCKARNGDLDPIQLTIHAGLHLMLEFDLKCGSHINGGFRCGESVDRDSWLLERIHFDSATVYLRQPAGERAGGRRDGEWPFGCRQQDGGRWR